RASCLFTSCVLAHSRDPYQLPEEPPPPKSPPPPEKPPPPSEPLEPPLQPPDPALQSHGDDAAALPPRRRSPTTRPGWAVWRDWTHTTVIAIKMKATRISTGQALPRLPRERLAQPRARSFTASASPSRTSRMSRT